MFLPLSPDLHKETSAGKLQGTPYGNEGYIETLQEDFDEDAKCLFRAIEEGGDDVYTVRIGGRGDDFEDENGLCSIELGYLNVDRCECRPPQNECWSLISNLSP